MGMWKMLPVCCSFDCLTCTLTCQQDENHIQERNPIQENQSLACFHMFHMDGISCISFCLHGPWPMTR